MSLAPTSLVVVITYSLLVSTPSVSCAVPFLGGGCGGGRLIIMFINEFVRHNNQSLMLRIPWRAVLLLPCVCPGKICTCENMFHLAGYAPMFFSCSNILHSAFMRIILWRILRRFGGDGEITNKGIIINQNSTCTICTFML